VNNPPGVNEMLAQLATLKTTVRDFVAREEKLNGEFRSQSAAELNFFSTRANAQEAAANAQEAAAADAFETTQAQWQARLAARRARLNHAHAAVSRQVLDQISRADTEWKDRTQLGVQAAERRREDELANATTVHEHFQQQLAAAARFPPTI